MIDIKDKSKCCGCTACSSICAHAAISMEPDELGFLYPSVDASRCVDCGLCEIVCQFHIDYKRYDNLETPKAYSLRLKDQDQLMRSQSGGAFYAIADYVLRTGGVVYGAAFNDQWSVVHQKASNHDELERLRMTKYVQSDMRGVYRSIKKELQDNHQVLFSGTSCQVAGLKSYIPTKLHENLICIDIICHGVPSPKIWQDYLAYLEKKYKSKIVKACSRDKRFGWHGARESFTLQNGTELHRRTSNYLYFYGYTLRESCASCVFTNTKRVGDITVGDHWGLPKDSPYEKDAKGLSLLFVNSAKGDTIVKNVIDSFIYESVQLEDCLQPQLQYPSKLNPQRPDFIDDYKAHGFMYVAKRYGDMGWRYKLSKTIETIKSIIIK